VVGMLKGKQGVDPVHIMLVGFVTRPDGVWAGASAKPGKALAKPVHLFIGLLRLVPYGNSHCTVRRASQKHHRQTALDPLRGVNKVQSGALPQARSYWHKPSQGAEMVQALGQFAIWNVRLEHDG